MSKVSMMHKPFQKFLGVPPLLESFEFQALLNSGDVFVIKELFLDFLQFHFFFLKSVIQGRQTPQRKYFSGIISLENSIVDSETKVKSNLVSLLLESVREIAFEKKLQFLNNLRNLLNEWNCWQVFLFGQDVFIFSSYRVEIFV
jgi:hypothetical protein